MSSYLTFVYQGYLISLIKFTCMQFSRYNIDWLIITKPMGLSGLEPPTSRLSGVRSNQLSYKPIMCSHIGRLYESVKGLLFLTGDITLIYHSYILTFI